MRIAWVIIVANVVATVAADHLAGGAVRRTAPGTALLLTVAFAAVGAFPMRLEFRRHQVTFTMTDAVLVAAFPVLPPVVVGAAAAVGELMSCRLHGVSPLKTLFNASNRLGAATVAAVIFAAAGGGRAWEWRDWQAALIAAGCYSVLNMAAVGAVLAGAEGLGLLDVFASSLPTAVATTLIAAPLGLIATGLTSRGALSAILLVPVAVGLALNNRSAAMHRDEHLRVERLHDATSRTAELRSFAESMATLADEARRLLTGAVAMCCTADPDGAWGGVVVDDAGRAPLERAATAALRDLAETMGVGYCRNEDLPLVLRRLAPAQALAAVAVAGTSSAPLVLVVHRRPAPGESQRGHLETLTAFATHASLILTNARLYAEVETALATQIDLNRQKSEFVAAVSHELRTPLTSVLGALRTMVRLESRKPDDKRIPLLEISLQEGARLRRLIEDLLLVAATEHGAPAIEAASVDVEATLAALVAEMPPPIRAEVALSTADVRHPVRSDAHVIRQIVVNLVENAAKYAPGGTEVTASTDPDRLAISVSDHGPGIPAEDRDRVFERFVQLDQSVTRRQGGTGLGLYLCRQLAARLGGELAVTDTPGGGCTFTLTVPTGGRGAARAGAGATAAASGPTAAGAGPTAAVDAPPTAGTAFVGEAPGTACYSAMPTGLSSTI